MNNEQVDLVRRSFDAMWPIRRHIALAFYARFFEIDPDVRRLFPSDMERLHVKLMDAIAAIVGALDDRELLRGIVSQRAGTMRSSAQNPRISRRSAKR